MTDYKYEIKYDFISSVEVITKRRILFNSIDQFVVLTSSNQKWAELIIGYNSKSNFDLERSMVKEYLRNIKIESIIQED